jgi:hypothetical protein
MKMVFDGRTLLDMQRDYDNGYTRGNSYFLLREWDGSIRRARVEEVHGSVWTHCTDGVTLRYRDGLSHRVSLR